MSKVTAEPDDHYGRQNLMSLFMMRNFIMGGLALLIVMTVWGLEIPLQQDPLWSVLAAQLVVNSLTGFRLQFPRPVTERELFCHLLWDALSTALLLYFAGGATNPLTWIFLLPLILTATILPPAYTWYMVLTTVCCFTVLIGYHIDLPRIAVVDIRPSALLDPAHQHIIQQGIELHTFGIWFGFVMTAGLVAYFVVEMANNLRERDRKLAEAREQTLRSERVVALGTLAAAAAHEMGTPLGTMALLVDELGQEVDTDGETAKSLAILRAQIDRCKKALAVLSASAGEMRAESGSKMAVDRYVEEVIAQWQAQQRFPAPLLHTHSSTPAPAILAEQTLTYALLNLLNNAGEVSGVAPVRLEVAWDDQQVHIEILDRGPGMAPQIREQLGKAPLTTKKSGLGVGVFLAFQTIQRLGGNINLGTGQDGGTRMSITLPILPQEDPL